MRSWCLGLYLILYTASGSAADLASDLAVMFAKDHASPHVFRPLARIYLSDHKRLLLLSAKTETIYDPWGLSYHLQLEFLPKGSATHVEMNSENTLSSIVALESAVAGLLTQAASGDSQITEVHLEFKGVDVLKLRSQLEKKLSQELSTCSNERASRPGCILLSGAFFGAIIGGNLGALYKFATLSPLQWMGGAAWGTLIGTVAGALMLRATYKVIEQRRSNKNRCFELKIALTPELRRLIADLKKAASLDSPGQLARVLSACELASSPG